MQCLPTHLCIMYNRSIFLPRRFIIFEQVAKVAISTAELAGGAADLAGGAYGLRSDTEDPIEAR